MRARENIAEDLSAPVRIVWPEHSPEELTEIIKRYIASEDSAVFAEAVDGQYAGVALCALRHDYVEGCELTSSASLRFHLSVGFREENRIICFKKARE